MKILITGCNGQLGKELQKQLKEGCSVLGQLPECFHDTEIYPFDLPDLDIRDLSAVMKLVSEISPDLSLTSQPIPMSTAVRKNPMQPFR